MVKLQTPKFLAKTDVLIKMAEGFDENGDYNFIEDINVKARVESSNSVAYTKEGHKVTLSAKVFIFDKLDKFDVKMVGKCIIEGNEYDILSVAKLLNPDGSVNHFKLGLI